MCNKEFELKGVMEPLNKNNMKLVDENFNEDTGDCIDVYYREKDNRYFREYYNWDSNYHMWLEMIFINQGEV